MCSFTGAHDQDKMGFVWRIEHYPSYCQLFAFIIPLADGMPGRLEQ